MHLLKTEGVYTTNQYALVTNDWLQYTWYDTIHLLGY